MDNKTIMPDQRGQKVSSMFILPFLLRLPGRSGQIKRMYMFFTGIHWLIVIIFLRVYLLKFNFYARTKPCLIILSVIRFDHASPRYGLFIKNVTYILVWEIFVVSIDSLLIRTNQRLCWIQYCKIILLSLFLCVIQIYLISYWRK